MIRFVTKFSALTAMVVGAAMSQAQIPDLITAFDAGGRSLGLGGSIGATGSGPASGINNPAGLGYASKPQFSLTFRNLTESKTKLTRSFVNPDYETSGKSGNRALSQVGFSSPFRGGTVGLNYSIGGYINDVRTGTNLVDGGTILNNYNEIIRAKTDFFTLSWGKASSDYRRSFGVGLVFASHNTRNLQSYQLFDNNGTPTDTGDDSFISNETLDNSGQMYGFGAVVGLQFNPSADFSYGLSVRTPISMTGDAEVEDYYSRIPGKVSFGVARRLNRGVKSEDFMLLGAQVDWFFGKSDKILSRKDSQLAGGFGAEYNYRLRNAYIPLRAGFRYVGEGGDGFQKLSAFTWGLGYNPDGSDFGLDLDFGSNSVGGMDMSLSLTYRFK